MIENRRSRRKPPPQGITVVDSLTGREVGQVGNLSIDGMLLIADRAITDDALFQFNFELPGSEPRRRIEIGVHEQWGEPANTPGHYFAGFRIIDIAADDRKALGQWIEGRDE